MSASDVLVDLRAYTLSHAQAGDLIIYWIQESETLGVTDGQDTAFEKEVTQSERSELLGGVACSLVERRWTAVMRDRKLGVKKLTADDITLSYINQMVTLQKLNEGETKSRLKKLSFALVKELMLARNENVPVEAKPTKAAKPPLVIEKTQHQSLFDGTRRKRKGPTGFKLI